MTTTWTILRTHPGRNFSSGAAPCPPHEILLRRDDRLYWCDLFVDDDVNIFSGRIQRMMMVVAQPLCVVVILARRAKWHPQRWMYGRFFPCWCHTLRHIGNKSWRVGRSDEIGFPAIIYSELVVQRDRPSYLCTLFDLAYLHSKFFSLFGRLIAKYAAKLPMSSGS